MDPDTIFILKTNINAEHCKQRAAAALDAHEEIECWSVDLNDIDCVLRIISSSLNYEKIISIINSQGFECAELK